MTNRRTKTKAKTKYQINVNFEIDFLWGPNAVFVEPCGICNIKDDYNAYCETCNEYIMTKKFDVICSKCFPKLKIILDTFK